MNQQLTVEQMEYNEAESVWNSVLSLEDREYLAYLHRQCVERSIDPRDAFITIRTVRSVMLKKYSLKPKLETIENTTITMPKSEGDTILPDACGICLENHKKSETVLCGCKHAFGRECLDGWKEVCKNSKEGLTCPMCRHRIVKTTSYTV